ncbi:MAG TPA: lysophospholipid acyltransferase family protein [Methylomirabilota bacterium]|nr:lysophospholipid acyltransferase family protein [Methylomirabilota bacterium]
MDIASREETGALYATVRAVGRFWIWFFFKAVDLRHADRVPTAGAVLLCINHPNNLIDSLLVAAALDRKVHFLATAALFRNPLVARFLHACGAIPVYRKQDVSAPGNGVGVVGAERNVDAFTACFRTLAAGGLVGIYPEGTTHAEPRVQRIKTGAARIALEYEARRERGDEPGGPSLALVPVGLTFEARKSFRGRVLVMFGEPMRLAPYIDRYRTDPAQAVEALTTSVQVAMEALVVSVSRLDWAALIRAVDDLYRGELVRELHEERGLALGQIDTIRLSRAIAEAAQHFAEREPDRVEALWQRIQGYRGLLWTYRVRDEAVRARLSRPRLRVRLQRGSWVGLGLPLFLYGVLVNGLPYFIPRMISHRFARKETDYATTRLLASVVAIPLFWGLETWLVWRLMGALWAAAFAISLPLSGLFAYRYLGGVGRLRSQIRLGAMGLVRHQAASRLLDERREIIAELERAKNDYLAATRGSSF